MPTVLRIDGLRVVIYPNDHPPAHVHVVGADVKTSFLLNCPDGPAAGRVVIKLSRRQVERIEVALNENLRLLCDTWRDMHGHF